MLIVTFKHHAVLRVPGNLRIANQVDETIIFYKRNYKCNFLQS